MHNTTVCRMHGGKAIVPAIIANTRHGRYSRVLPPGLQAEYDRNRDDPELLDLRDEIALVRTLLERCIEVQMAGEKGGGGSAAANVLAGFLRPGRKPRPGEDEKPESLDLLEFLNILTQLNDRLSKAVLRYEQIRHKQTNVVTHGKMVIWIRQVGDVVMGGIRDIVKDDAERERLLENIRSGLARLGMPSSS